MPVLINGDDLDTIMQEAQDDGGREYLTERGFDLESVVAKSQGLAIALFEENQNPHYCAAAAYLIGLETGLRAMEKFKGADFAPKLL